MYHKRMSLKTMVGKFKGGWGALPRQPKVRYVGDSLCHDVISTMTCNRLIHGFTSASMLLHSIITSAIFLVLEW